MNGELARAALAGRDPGEQRALDTLLVETDGAEQGAPRANAILGCSLAAARAAANDAGVSLFRWLGGDAANVLPVPMMNVVNGGAHAQNSLDLGVRWWFRRGRAFSRTSRSASRSSALKDLLHERNLATAVGDEGGFARSRLEQEAIGYSKRPSGPSTGTGSASRSIRR